MKIKQMAFMLIAVMILFVLVGMFFLVSSFSGLKESATEIEKENAMLLVTKIANSPEFACGKSLGESRTNCIDEDKVMILKNRIENYKNFWGVSSITIRKIYPENENVICNKGDYPDCDTIKVLEGTGTEIANYVALCRKENDGSKIYNKCELAQISASFVKK